MAKFKDNQQREWTLDLNVTLVKKIRAMFDVDLYRAFDGDMAVWAGLMDDPITLVNIIYVMCEPQRPLVTDEEFGAALSGDTLKAAGDAFTDALIDFFPSPRKRDLLRETMSKARQLYALRELRALHEMQAVDLSKVGSESSTDAPASAASTPAPSPPAS